MHPALNLVLATVIAGLTYLLFRVRRGWFWRWLRQGIDPERVRTEDALKHLYHSQEGGQAASIESLAGALEMPRHMAARLADSLQRHQLAKLVGTRLALTQKGQHYALLVIRTHRLWEQYLAQQTGLDELEWHEQAEYREHQLTPAEVDRLAASMGDPLYDPHGDPIPTANGVLPAPRGVPLGTIATGEFVRVVHIEDEPPQIYRRLRLAGLALEMVIRIDRHENERIILDLRPGHCVLSSVEAVNVSVEVVSAPPEQPSGIPMADLPVGQAAIVQNILPSCHGIERRRLLDLGLVPGTRVHAELRSAAGDPTAYRIRGALIALRNQQAEKILVSIRQDDGKNAL